MILLMGLSVLVAAVAWKSRELTRWARDRSDAAPEVSTSRTLGLK